MTTAKSVTSENTGFGSADKIPTTREGLRIGTTDQAFISAFRGRWPELVEITNVNDVQYLDLLVIPGGADVSPSRYGANDNGLCYPDEMRDEKEFALFKKADELKIAVLGVCRGLQLINVARGGTLIMDLRTSGKIHSGTHKIDWLKNPDGTVVKAKLKGSLPENVNSYHHQGIQRLGTNLVSVASYQGVPEIILGETHIIATQFHPEMMGESATPFFNLITSWVSHIKAEKEEALAEATAKATAEVPAPAPKEAVTVTISKKTTKKKVAVEVDAEAASPMTATTFATAASNTTNRL